MKYSQYISLLLFIFIFSSCGEDRSGEFYALIEDRQWIENTMRENYLWCDEMPIIENENDYFEEPATFFKNLLYKDALNGKGDIYSYLEEISIEDTRSLSLDHTSTYGIEFELVTDPLKTTTHTFAHVLYVLPNSPAATVGLKRGDWISAINQVKITNDNYSSLQKGNGISLAIEQVKETENGWEWQSTDTLKVGPSIPMEINPILIDTLYQIEGRKIAYLVYNEFATGPNNNATETVYIEQMKQVFERFKAVTPDAFILDLRYNSGGYLQCAQALGSMIVPTSELGKDFITLQFNHKASQPTITYPLETIYADANLNLHQIYILTSSYTASASEALINGLKPYVGNDNVILLGEKTSGKNVAMRAYPNETYGFTLWPVVAYVLNSNLEGDYTDGIEPQYVLNEDDLTIPWYNLGDTNEFYLKNTLSLITTGLVPSNTSSSNKGTEANYQPIVLRNITNVCIP